MMTLHSDRREARSWTEVRKAGIAHFPRGCGAGVSIALVTRLYSRVLTQTLNLTSSWSRLIWMVASVFYHIIYFNDLNRKWAFSLLPFRHKFHERDTLAPTFCHFWLSLNPFPCPESVSCAHSQTQEGPEPDDCMDMWGCDGTRKAF